MNKYFKLRGDFLKIISIFFVWRFVLIVVLLFVIKNVPLAYSDRFLGGGPNNYKIYPELFSWANFDGEHYLSIAIFGYKGLEQAFFPLYPILISFFAKPISSDLFSQILNYTFVGLIISHLSLLISLIYLWELITIDFPKKIAFLTLALILFFPTSFYFGAVYNESLFLLLSVLAFYNGRKGRWFLASFFGMIASATRVFGILILPALVIEAFLQKERLSKTFWLLFIPLGLGSFMVYQYFTVGDPFAFYNIQKFVGEQHQGGVTLLPQVYFRYMKMILTVDMQSPIYQTIILEFITGIVFFLLPIIGYFKKVRISYLLYAMMGFLLPTVTGSMTSVPRYVLVFFPSFIVLSIILDKLKLVRYVVVIIFITLLIVETTLFLRGYWVA